MCALLQSKFFCAPENTMCILLFLNIAPIGRPTNVTTIDIDSTSIHIYWSHPPEDTHYGFLREYRLNVTELETGDKWRVVVEAEATEALLMPLHPYYTYHITIVPVTVEEGDNYTEITLRTAEDGELEKQYTVAPQ